VAAVATAFAVLAPAAPASAVGEGCLGFPSIPEAYVCVVTLDPTAALPGTSSGSYPVTVPEFCYLAGCVPARTVYVPVPGTSSGSGYVAVLYYRGEYYSVGVWGPTHVPTTAELIDLLLDEDTQYLIRTTGRCVLYNDCDG
jgi:hypothetical protein